MVASASRGSFPSSVFGNVTMPTPPTTAAPCCSYTKMWAWSPHTRNPLRRDTCVMMAIRLEKVPDGTYSAASLPVYAATRASSAATVGSSPHTSSPTTAVAIAVRISGVGRVKVSERSSTAGVEGSGVMVFLCRRCVCGSRDGRVNQRKPRPKSGRQKPSTELASGVALSPLLPARAHHFNQPCLLATPPTSSSCGPPTSTRTLRSTGRQTAQSSRPPPPRSGGCAARTAWRPGRTKR